MSNLRQNKPPDRTMLERRWSPPQAQKPQDGGGQTGQCVSQPTRDQ